MTNGILLESGTNEMELLVFRVGESRFGVNVAKVRELIQSADPVHVPFAPPAVEGSFRLREEVLTLVNLGRYLGYQGSADAGQGLVIIIELNNARFGVRVDAVERIHRLRWDQIAPPAPLFDSLDAPLTSTAMVDDQVVLILDFETIVSELLGIEVLGGAGCDADASVQSEGSAANARILVADDSPTVRDTLLSVLQRAGYENIELFGDGQQAWDALEASRADGAAPYAIVLTDIEMPRIDGLHLTARIRQDPKLADIPVVLFSSIIHDDTFNKGKAVGANAQVTKRDVDGLLKAMRQYLGAANA